MIWFFVIKGMPQLNKTFSRATAQGRQNLIMLLCCFVYVSAYFGRYSYSSSINSIIGNYGIDKAQTGLVMTFFFVAYGAGQVINGFLCKHYPSRYIFPVALWSSALINLTLFAGIKTGYIAEFFYLVKYIWMLNGFAQSLLWTSAVFILGKNMEKPNIPKSTLVMGIAVSVGIFSAYSFSSLLEHLSVFEFSFVFAAIIMSIAGAVWLFLFTPHTRTDTAPDETETNKTGKNGVSHAAVFTLICLAIFAVSSSFIKDGLQTWIPTILKETYRFSNALSLALATSIYMFAVLGPMFVKKAYKTLKNFTALAIIIFVFISVFIFGMVLTLNISPLPIVLFFVLIIICCYGINNIITILAPLGLREEFNPGITAGVLDGLCYVGSALSSYTLGLVADKYNWAAVITMLFIIAVSITAITFALKIFAKTK